ncbi:hypothetical protein [Pseudodesulfovibrio sp. zrk46]|uniref:hypothetical protein n=1 Tax=Pseudodesulfovibrio sp. zrk46 TaxID=2725288 RepID=UPI00144A0D37|nr:hypothetical protein [Pseudodesulfovibrio sp. zrk46]QJB55714.1 hypothetical protein HFN16_04555 [Pseudodesulfovibrio sp. zrk46]
MRVQSYASQQYQKNAIAERTSERRSTEPQASVKTTSFGFRLGKFGLDFQSQSTIIDPSLSRDVRQERQKAQAFETEKQVENLRAKVGAEGANFRDISEGLSGTANDSGSSRPKHEIKAAISAYERNTQDVMPPPGNMLASVI